MVRMVRISDEIIAPIVKKTVSEVLPLTPLTLQIVAIQKDIEYIKLATTNIQSKLECDYVTKTVFDPIKKLVFGLVALILVSVVTGGLILVLK